MSEPSFPIEATHVLMFARAIHDEDPVFRDAQLARERGLNDIPAPLTFVQAGAQFDPDYPLWPKPDTPWFGSGADAGFRDPALTTVLHAEQHFTLHRPLTVGDVLTWQVRDGQTWTKPSRPVGSLTFHEIVTQFRDAAGELVVTARAVTVDTAGQGAGR